MRILRLAKVRFTSSFWVLYGSPECRLLAGLPEMVDMSKIK